MTQPTAKPIAAYIGLGSNLQDPVGQIRRARAAIAQTEGIAELAFSGLYRNPPMGPADQPDYVNAVMAVSTTLEPHALLHALQAIENSQGRVRLGERWGPRTLDLDILLYGQQQIATADLTVPHVGAAERAFVLLPLLEIAPELNIPGKGLVRDLAAAQPADTLIRIDS
ncbi:2-amino-4-hydroxy-6-hydroxymethyldihydropteridine diphosphokinase [Methylogaea oryzae]|uniref:2-amino-4-hydroxy-6-hydroxymethyldihydropteridine pyrophosphokinase n=1 Tax=Methylogaea oryzae TaxID=1295382 RepID=A0A8D5AJ49_9GAMM|nr:2-amino-4-hydroxy-6-hydroxymethyldihydropteridine diphosphokinase [Methylogaea oryzae]BBL70409.1 2-amino-4-hydroxy-6-hydroxymethyldihydropteridine diphosphokinase [Methylogaea oryzae]